MGFHFLTQELAIDLGTANTVIFQNDQIILDEPSIVAIDNSSGKPIALGQQAKMMHEREAVKGSFIEMQRTMSSSTPRPASHAGVAPGNSRTDT